MPSEDERATIFQCGDFDESALCRLASKLRGGYSCFCDTAQIPACGSFNWTIQISFDDGVQWVLRSPRTDGAIRSKETNLSLLASEAATLKYIRVNSTIPVPQVFAYSSSWDNDVGIPYILMAKAHGSPLQCTWSDTTGNKPSITQDQKEKILFQLGSITWQLSQLSFDQAGSLFEEDGQFQIKTCLARGLLLNQRHSIEDLDRGPFRTKKAYYDAHILAFLEHVKYLPLGHHCFFAPIPAQTEYEDYTGFRNASDWWSDFVTIQSKIDGSENRSDYVVVGEVLSEMITRWAKDVSESLLDNSKPAFSIHHPDLSVDNIFVDEYFNITCVIDWAFSSSVPFSILLTAPGLPQSRYEVDRSLLPAFENGFRHALEENTKYENIESEMRLYQVLSCSRPFWLLSRILNFDSTADYHLFQALWDCFGKYNHDISDFFLSRQSLQQYITLRNELQEDDRTAVELAAIEEEYFHNDVCRLTIARKLTLVSQWSFRYHESPAHGIRANGNIFVADRSLWRWINSCLIT